MASERSIFPVRDAVETDTTANVMSLDTADRVFETLQSTTARRLVAEVYEGPATASDLAEAVDTSLQNVQYHVDRLREAGLIDAVGTWYSERGTEMTVYGPAAEPLVICAGPADSEAGIRQLLDQSGDATPSTA